MTARTKRNGYKAISVWTPRPLPVAVFFADDQTLVGPFCGNCGFTEAVHVTDKVQGGVNKGMVITACPPPNGINPMDPRCVPCTLKAMHLHGPPFAQHKWGGLFHEDPPPPPPEPRSYYA